MKLEEIRSIAESWGVHPSKLSKAQSLKSIQTEEGDSFCFAFLQPAAVNATRPARTVLMQR